jgi:hypothetical protein
MRDKKEIGKDRQPAGWPKENPFLAPEGYFERLPAEIMERISLFSETSEEGRPAPFRAPDGYFEHLTESILHRTVNIPEQPRIVPIYKRPAAILAAAAIAASFFLFSPSRHALVIQPALDQVVTVEELQQSYLADDLDELTLKEELAQTISNDDDNENELQEYLIDNGADLSQINI